MVVTLNEELAVAKEFIGHWTMVIGRLINRFGCGSELTQVIGCANIGRSLVTRYVSGLIDGMTGGGALLIPETAVRPSLFD